MSKYPGVLLFRHDKYSHIDDFIITHNTQYNCTITNIKTDINSIGKLFTENYHVIVTLGESESSEYHYISDHIVERFANKWIHKSISDFKNISDFNESINYNYVYNVIQPRITTRPQFSLFTTCYKSFDFIKTAYTSIKTQTLKDWEWVILDDSPGDDHFVFLKELFDSDYRVRLYKRSGNSGNIGNVKNEAISLCRGKYLLEMDHDDIIFDSCLQDAYTIFEKNDKIGFVYADTVPMYRDFTTYTYGDFTGKGYGSDYLQYRDNKWIYVYLTPSINNITLSHLVCCPNHPRIWRRTALMEMESYSEYLPICDDYEILLKTCCNYEVAKINKPLYIQFANNDGNNFSSIRNEEINRIGPQYISPIFYKEFNVHETMKHMDAFEDPEYIDKHSKIWKRDNYQHKRMNYIYNFDYTHQYCIINDDIFNDDIIELCKTPENEFIFLTNKYTEKKALEILEHRKLFNVKCKSQMDCSDEELIKFFNMLFKNDNCESTIMNYSNISLYPNNTTLNEKHEFINSIIKKENYSSYLEIGIESGYTFNNIDISEKYGIDADINSNITTYDYIQHVTSNDFFSRNERKYDIILIDGMHQVEYVCNDFMNSLKSLNNGGSIIISDIFPHNYREQLTIPINHEYSNNILKYKEPWTGDVWKVVYHLIMNYDFEFEIFHSNPNNRGIIQIKNFKQNVELLDIDTINKYNYNTHFDIFQNTLFFDKYINKTHFNGIITKSNEYRNNTPYPHIELNDFLHPTLATNILEFIKSKEQEYLYVNDCETHSREKFVLMNESNFDSNSKMLFKFLKSEMFMQYISDVVNIPNLISDPTNRGGGFHIIKKGGLLALHQDFNYHLDIDAYRRVNLLLYLNEDWKPECGGSLELYDSDNTNLTIEIEPLFNKAVVLKVDSKNNIHGHPQVWQSDKHRYSIAMYYYTKEPPSDMTEKNRYVQWFDK